MDPESLTLAQVLQMTALYGADGDEVDEIVLDLQPMFESYVGRVSVGSVVRAVTQLTIAGVQIMQHREGTLQ